MIEMCTTKYYILEVSGEGGAEGAVREVLRRTLGFSREIGLVRARRAEGSSVRGTPPITVCFEKYQVAFLVALLRIPIAQPDFHIYYFFSFSPYD